MFVMKKIRFGDKWRKWISSSRTSNRFAFIINGKARGHFEAQGVLGKGTYSLLCSFPLHW